MSEKKEEEENMQRQDDEEKGKVQEIKRKERYCTRDKEKGKVLYKR